MNMSIYIHYFIFKINLKNYVTSLIFNLAILTNDLIKLDTRRTTHMHAYIVYVVTWEYYTN